MRSKISSFPEDRLKSPQEIHNLISSQNMQLLLLVPNLLINFYFFFTFVTIFFLSIRFDRGLFQLEGTDCIIK